MPATVLIIDDEQSILETVGILLRSEGFETHTFQNGRDAIDRLGEMKPDLVLSDIRMPAISGIEVLEAVRAKDPGIPVILMTAQASLQSAIKAVNEGAYYYLQKPFGNDELVTLCRRAVETRTLKTENTELKKEIKRQQVVIGEKPLGKNRLFLDILRMAETVAPTDSTVLISGESGTGKEVLARYIHRLSARENAPFISINCGALPENLLESELFGHMRGSFTGAVRDKEGLMAAARGGTFFLDEVAEMSPGLQVKFLRALQEREVVPVGSTEPVKIDVRIVAATNRELEKEIRSGQFRSDLYYRLNVITLHIPPLRERRDDIPLFAEHFLRRLNESRSNGHTVPAALGQDSLDAMQSYDWPGNVREMENALERAAILSAGQEQIPLSALPKRITEPEPEPLVADRTATNPTLDLVERAYIMWVLDSEGGNKAKAADVLGIDPSTLYRKLSRYGVAGTS
jgi:DNA-binding NtrC family response regulator